MAFTVHDFEDLYRLLSEHPDWRARLRPLILGDEFIQVPARLNAIDERLDRISTSIELHDTRLNDIDANLLEISRLLREMTDRQNRMEGRLGNIEGDLLELRYAGNVGNWFRRQLFRPQRLFIDELESLSAAQASGQISEEDVDRVARADLIVRGTRRDGSDELLLAVEVSTTINQDDVERADRVAGILRQAGYQAKGFVGGQRATSDALERAKELEVVIDLHRPAA